MEPALEILVNTGYTDVVTPTDGGTYTRTYRQSGDYVSFLSQAALTPAEWLQVPGDVLRALVVGFQDAFPILRFGQTAPMLTVDGNHLAITYPPPVRTAPAADLDPADPPPAAPAIRHESAEEDRSGGDGDADGSRGRVAAGRPAGRRRTPGQAGRSPVSGGLVADRALGG